MVCGPLSTDQAVNIQEAPALHVTLQVTEHYYLAAMGQNDVRTSDIIVLNTKTYQFTKLCKSD